MSSYPVTTSLRVIKELQWVKETLKGVTPNNPVFSAVATAEFTPAISSENTRYMKLGTPDLTAVIKSTTNYDFDVVYSPVDSLLLQSLINIPAAGTVGHREDSFTFLISQEHNNSGVLAEQYQIARGARVSSATITVEVGGLVVIESSWIPLSIADWSTSHTLIGPTFAPTITLTPWNAINVGNNPLTFDGRNYDLISFSTTINHNVQRITIINQQGTQTIRVEPGARDIGLEIAIVYKDNELSEDVKTLTARTMSMRLNAVGGNTCTLSFTDVYLEEYDEEVSAESTNIKTVRYRGFAESVITVDAFSKNVIKTLGETTNIIENVPVKVVAPKRAVKTLNETITILEAGLTGVGHTTNQSKTIIDTPPIGVLDISVTAVKLTAASDFDPTNFDTANFVV